MSRPRVQVPGFGSSSSPRPRTCTSCWCGSYGRRAGSTSSARSPWRSGKANDRLAVVHQHGGDRRSEGASTEEAVEATATGSLARGEDPLDTPHPKGAGNATGAPSSRPLADRGPTPSSVPSVPPLLASLRPCPGTPWGGSVPLYRSTDLRHRGSLTRP
jgi:hypothetical protein